MRAIQSALLACVVVGAAVAQAPEPPLSETRLTVHTLVREDIFAGFREDNLERLSRAEKNIEILLGQRPDQRASLLAWKAGAATYRAVRAHEARQPEEFARRFAAALDGFAVAAKLESGRDGVAAITGGTMVLLADRLPEKVRPAAWSQAYDNYSLLWKEQGRIIEKMPVHHRGEVLSGMAQSAQRTGRSDESAQFVDRMLTMLADTRYEATAREWKANPASAATTNLTCKSCHNEGRLSNQLAALKK